MDRAPRHGVGRARPLTQAVRRRLPLVELLIIVAVLVGLMAVVRLFMPRIVPFFVFYPETLEPHETHPRYWGFPQATEVRIPTEDAVELHAWWFPANPPESRRGTAIYFHGNAGHLGDRGAVAAALSNLGLDILLPDYRGYGASEGKPSEEGLYTDAKAAYRWLVDERSVDPERLLPLGNSLGSSVAAELAVTLPVAGVVLLGPFTDTPAIARHRLSWLPDWYLDWLHNRFDTLDRAPRIEVPTFVAAGEEDQVIPPGQSREVFEALRGPRRWLEIPGAGHNDIFSHELLWRELHRFTRDILVGEPPERRPEP